MHTVCLCRDQCVCVGFYNAVNQSCGSGEKIVDVSLVDVQCLDFLSAQCTMFFLDMFTLSAWLADQLTARLLHCYIICTSTLCFQYLEHADNIDECNFNLFEKSHNMCPLTKRSKCEAQTETFQLFLPQLSNTCPHTPTPLTRPAFMIAALPVDGLRGDAEVRLVVTARPCHRWRGVSVEMSCFVVMRGLHICVY